MDEDDDGEIYVPIKQRRAMKAAAMAQQAAGLQQREKRSRGLVAETSEVSSAPKRQSLLDQRAEMLATGSSRALHVSHEAFVGKARDLEDPTEVGKLLALKKCDQGFGKRPTT